MNGKWQLILLIIGGVCIAGLGWLTNYTLASDQEIRTDHKEDMKYYFGRLEGKMDNVVGEVKAQSIRLTRIEAKIE